jgi:hypothetical protein
MAEFGFMFLISWPSETYALPLSRVQNTMAPVVVQGYPDYPDARGVVIGYKVILHLSSIRAHRPSRIRTSKKQNTKLPPKTIE